MGYDLHPETKITDFSWAGTGNEAIVTAIKQEINKRDKDNLVVAFECYPGTDLQKLRTGIIDPLQADHVSLADDFALPAENIHAMIDKQMTDDRVFGKMTFYDLADFFPDAKKEQDELSQLTVLSIIYGTGATLLCPKPDLLVYCDLSRWEIQLRFRKGMPNWRQNNNDDDPLKKFKRGYFWEWRIADKVKAEKLPESDFVIDTNNQEKPNAVRTQDLLHGLKKISQQPFRTVPYFDASVWGGQWMKDQYKLPDNGENYGWAFDGVPEENSLYLRFGGTRMEVPAMDLILLYPQALLGNKVFTRFGAEFPIRFDYLDTYKGGNLSLQVHPLTEYIRKHYGMTYTQDESYYILEATDHSSVYLGVKPDVNLKGFQEDLERAAAGQETFPDEKYINHIPAKRGDHFLIPAGTVHCGGADTVVLEISATPYIFTFKLWDWGRIGLDGKPRPIHIDEGMANIDFSRDTEWVNKHLVNHFSTIESNKYQKVERTGLERQLEFIETYRHTIKTVGTFKCHGSVNMLNLVDGDQAIVKSIDGSFAPFIVHFGETFIVPASVNEYLIQNTDDSKSIRVIQAFVGR
jgi:mannose-6-phosphate isomerase class I